MFEILKITCVKCGQDSEFFCSANSKRPTVCTTCEPPRMNILFTKTINLKNYKKNGGNVSEARIKMIKNRKICPDGNGEVVMMDRGKITDRPAYNY